MSDEQHHCPCCGLPLASPLVDPASRCPCCLFSPPEEGRENMHPDVERHSWIKDGMPWRSLADRPADWQPLQHLALLARTATLKRVKGRPPRLHPPAISPLTT